MKYKIYKLVKPAILETKDIVNHYIETTNGLVLQELKEHGIESEHDTAREAMREIVEKKDRLKNQDLLIIPVISIDYEGKMRS